MEPEGRPWEGPTAQGWVPPTGDRWAAAEGHTFPSGTPSVTSNAYKIIPDAKTLTREGFSQIRNRAPPPLPTSFRGQKVPVSAP